MVYPQLKARASYSMDNSRDSFIVQKVGPGFTRHFSRHSLHLVIGLALFYAWNLFSIYGPKLIASASSGAPPYEFTVITSAAATAGFLAIAIGLHKIRSFESVGLAASSLATGIVLACVAGAAAAPQHAEAFGLAMDVACRLCSCWVIVAWGSRYALLNARSITLYTLTSFVCALLLCLILMASPRGIQLACFSAALPASMLLLKLANHENGSDAKESSLCRNDAHQKGMWGFVALTWRIILVFFLFGIVTWTSIIHVHSAEGFVSGHHWDKAVIMGACATTCLLLVAAIASKGTFTKAYIYRVVMPFAMAGMLAIGVFNSETSIGWVFVAIGYTCFDLFCFTLFANACRKTGANARVAFGWCRAIESAVPLVVVLIIAAMNRFANADGGSVLNIIAFSGVCIILAFALLGQTRLFEREKLDPTINYPHAEVLHFARQCEKAIADKKLSPREAEIFSLIVRGRSVPHIAQRLLISKSTVKTHVAHIYEKFGVNERQEMIDVIESMTPAEESSPGS